MKSAKFNLNSPLSPGARRTDAPCGTPGGAPVCGFGAFPSTGYAYAGLNRRAPLANAQPAPCTVQNYNRVLYSRCDAFVEVRISYDRDRRAKPDRHSTRASASDQLLFSKGRHACHLLTQKISPHELLIPLDYQYKRVQGYNDDNTNTVQYGLVLPYGMIFFITYQGTVQYGICIYLYGTYYVHVR